MYFSRHSTPEMVPGPVGIMKSTPLEETNEKGKKKEALSGCLVLKLAQHDRKLL